MANSDGQVKVEVVTNAKEVAKMLDKTSKAFEDSGDSARKAATVYDEYKKAIDNNIIVLRELALGNNQNSEGFKKLAAETRNYQKELDKANNIVNKATGGLASQANGMSELASIAKRLVGGYIGIQGAIKAFNFALSSVEAFRVQEHAVASLDTALKNAGVYTSEYSNHIQKLASEIQSYSNYGDEAIIKAQAVGQAFIGQTRITDELTKAVIDFAAANEMDLDNAFRLVGKSIGSNTNALARYGVELQKGLSDSQKMEAITKQLGERYQGQAQQMANASVQMKNALSDLTEAIGNQLNPAVEAAQKGIARWANVMTNAINRARILRSELSDLGGSELEQRIAENNKRIEKLQTIAQRDAQYNGKGFTTRDGKITSGSAQAEIARLKSQNNIIREQIKYIDQRNKALSKPIKLNDEINTGFGQNIGGGRGTSYVQGSKQVADAYTELQQKAQAARRAIENAAVTFGTSSPQVSAAFEAYRNLNNQLEIVNSLFDKQTQSAVAQQGAYAGLQTKLQELRQSLLNLATEGGIGTEQFEKLKVEYLNTTEQIAQIDKSLTEEMGNDWNKVGGQISHALSGTLISALQGGENALQSFRNLAVGLLQQVLDKMLEMAVIAPILNSLTGGAPSAGGGLLGGIGKLFGFKSGAAFNNGNVTPFARGGVVNKPTIFPMANGGTGLMGEAGAEAVMPLRRMSNGRLGVEAENGNGKAVQVNIYNQSGASVETRKRDDGSMDIFIRRVNEALSNERTSSGFRSAYAREDRKGVQAV